jgi:single-strand DNA-binding protein
MYHKIEIIGNLGKDPETRYTPSGKSVTSFSVATNRRYNASNGDRVEETAWFDVSAWNGLGQTCQQYLSRGSLVRIEGRLDPKPRIFQRKDGSYDAAYHVTFREITFLSRRPQPEGEAEVGGGQAQEEEYIPF